MTSWGDIKPSRLAWMIIELARREAAEAGVRELLEAKASTLPSGSLLEDTKPLAPSERAAVSKIYSDIRNYLSSGGSSVQRIDSMLSLASECERDSPEACYFRAVAAMQAAEEARLERVGGETAGENYIKQAAVELGRALVQDPSNTEYACLRDAMISGGGFDIEALEDQLKSHLKAVGVDA